VGRETASPPCAHAWDAAASLALGLSVGRSAQDGRQLFQQGPLADCGR
jgi:hypothetical protein